MPRRKLTNQEKIEYLKVVARYIDLKELHRFYKEYLELGKPPTLGDCERMIAGRLLDDGNADKRRVTAQSVMDSFKEAVKQSLQ